MKKLLIITQIVFVVVTLLLVGAVCAETTPTPVPTELKAASADMAEMGFDCTVVHNSRNKSHMDAVFDYLLEVKDDGTLGPGLATAWQQSEDGLEWIFDIRSGVKYHDGSTVTADDVAWTLRRIFLGEGVPSSMMATIYQKLLDSIEARGNQVIVRTKEPKSEVHFWMGEQMPVAQGTAFPKKYIEKVGIEAFREHPIGTGPWKFKERVMGQSIKFEAFEDYWQKQKVPKFSQITIMQIPELSTRVAMLKTGEVDIIEASVTVAKELKDAGLGIIRAESAHLATLFPLCQYEPGHPFNDKRVRQAVSMAIDRQGIINALYVGQGSSSTSYFGPGAYGFDKDAKPLPYNPEKAKQLLTEAGYPNGFEARIYTYKDPGDMPWLPEQAEMIASYLETIGIPTEVKVSEWSALKAQLGATSGGGRKAMKIPKNNPVPLFLRACDYRFEAISHYMNYYLTGYMGELVAQPDLDELIRRAMVEKDIDKAEKIWIEVGRLAYEEYYHIPTVRVDGVFGYNPNKLADWKTLPGRSMLHRLETAVPAR